MYEVSQDLLESIEIADEILHSIGERHKNQADRPGETRMFNYLHGTIAKANMDLEQLIQEYRILERTYNVD